MNMLIKAYAKLNLILNILGKRSDGYHEIESFMQAAELCDDVFVRIYEGDETNLSINHAGIPKTSNLAVRAAELMKQRYGKTCAVDIKIVKRIPIAAGLGGGSANAAAVITALAKHWGISDLNELMQVGSELGSDIPFCIAVCFGHRAAIARGRGNKLEFVEALDCRFEIERLNIHIKDKTKTVYAEVKPEDYAIPYDIDAFIKAKTLPEKEALMGNHLQAPAFRVFKRAGFEVPDYPVHMSGAGPAIFRIK